MNTSILPPLWRRSALAGTASLISSTVVAALTAVSSFADTKLVSDNAPLRYHVPANGNLGGTWRSPSFNDSSWTAGNNGVGYEVTPGAYSASVIADSRSEWSSAGRQGENSWVNGYYNKSTDANGTYQQNDFQPFPRDSGPWSPINFWDGGSWNWNPDNVPWDTIGQTDVHPNGVNNGEEHWVIRRWYSTASGPVTLRFHLRKSNLNGTGVTGKIFKNGVELFTRTIGGGDGTGFEVYVNTTAAVGDVFDFAQTPLGLGGDDGDGADGSIMTATILSGTIVPPTGPVVPVGIADSASDWSSAGVQGANGWFYGFYDRTADADATYNPNTDFNTTDPNWTFSGGAWQLGVTGDPGANPPWDTIGQTDWHPNGDNQPQGIHWVIRRWVCEVDGDIYARVRFAKANVNGNGTTLHVLRNGVEVYTATLNNTLGIDTFVPFAGAFIGDRIDFALDPLGTDGLFGDGSDSSTFTATLFTGSPPATATTVADSVADWSAAGVQGANGWTYGFYNETADADHVYNPSTDFNTTDPDWTFSGAWTLGPGDPPWDTIEQINWHPNGDNQPQGIHWVIRRWESDVDGDLHAHVQFGKQNTGGGNGTTLRVLHNGTQVFLRTVGGTDGTGIDTNVNLPGVFVGDKIEFALDPLGTDGSKNDGADGSFLRASILTGLIAPPPPPFVPGVADCFRTDIETAMKGVNPSVFIRIPFEVSDPAAIETLKLKIKYNDGFAAYLNGTEIVRRNAPTSIAGSIVADSIADWSANPDVTVNGWSYGYYDQSLDADGTYSGSSDFTPFPHDGAGNSPTDFWTGSGWDWFNGNPPWTELFQEVTHPNHPNGGAVDPGNPATHLHWTVRRWNATVDANLKCRVRFRKTNLNCGDGVRVSVFHNSVQVYSQTIAFNDGIGRDDTIDLPDVFLGDNIDVLLGPGDTSDYCDGSAFSAVLFEGEPTIPWDGAATASRTTTETISPEVFDLAGFISELQPGANVLAIQGFNAGVNDNEFVINAELTTDRGPSASDDSATVNADATATIGTGSLLTNDSDPDGDTLYVVGVNPDYLTAAGGAVRLFGDTIHYTPLPGFTGADSFRYTISSGGWGQASATVRINVVGAQPPTVAITSPADGATLPACATATICADANAIGGASIVQVVFIAAGVGPIGAAITPPYCIAVPNAPAGVYTLTAIATDSNGKSATSAPVRVTVADGPPVVNCPANVTAECTGGLTPVTFVTTATDVCDGPVPVTCVPPSGTGFRLGTSNVVCTATDMGGRSGSCSFTVTVVDSTPPRVTCAANITVDATSSGGAVVTYIASASDPCGIASFDCAPPSGSTFPIGTTTVTCTAVDGTGNPASCSFTVTVRTDNQPPTAVISSEQLIDLKPEYENPVLLSCNWWNACLVADGWTSSDPEGGDLTYLWSLEPDPVPFGAGPVVTNCLEVGTHTITLVVTDPGGLTGSTSKTIEIITAPLAIELLIEQVNESHKSGVVLSRKVKRELTATLRVALEHAGNEELRATQKALDAFEKKVRAQVVPTEPEAARVWIRWSQAVSEGMEKCIKPPRKHKDLHDDKKDDDRGDKK